MVKIFIGNLLEGGVVTSEDVRPLFEAHGTVTECEIMKNHGYGFVHMDSEQAAKTAVAELNGHDIKGRSMKVEFSNSKGSGRKNTQKFFIGNIADGTSDQELRALFEPYGTVTECDVMTNKNFGFVHIDASMGKGNLNKMVRELNGAELNGNKIRVEMSTGGGRGGGRGGGMGGRGGGMGMGRGFGRGRRDAPYPSPYRQGGGGYGRFEEDSYEGSGFGDRYGSQGGYGGGGPMRGHGGYADDYSSGYGSSGGYDSYGGYGGSGYGSGSGGYGSSSYGSSSYGSSGYGSSSYGSSSYGSSGYGDDRGFGVRGGRRGQGGPSAGGGRGAYQGTWSS